MLVSITIRGQIGVLGYFSRFLGLFCPIFYAETNNRGGYPGVSVLREVDNIDGKILKIINDVQCSNTDEDDCKLYLFRHFLFVLVIILNDKTEVS